MCAKFLQRVPHHLTTTISNAYDYVVHRSQWCWWHLTLQQKQSKPLRLLRKNIWITNIKHSAYTEYNISNLMRVSCHQDKISVNIDASRTADSLLLRLFFLLVLFHLFLDCWALKKTDRTNSAGGACDNHVCTVWFQPIFKHWLVRSFCLCMSATACFPENSQITLLLAQQWNEWND